MRSTPILGILLVTSLGLAGPAAAATLFVAINKAACSDTITPQQNTASQPFCTIQQAAKLASPGDTVLVSNGIYPDSDQDGTPLKIARSGTSAQPIVIRAQNRHQAHIKGQLPSSSTAMNHCVQTAPGVQHVVIEGFEISGCADGISINNNNHHITVRHNHLHDLGRRITSTTLGQTAVGVGSTCSNVTIDGNLIHTIGRLPGSPFENHDHGIYVRGSHLTITNNVFYDHQAGWAIHIYSPGHWKEYLHIVNNTFADPNPSRDGHILIYPMTRHTLIQNNISYQPRGALIRNHTCTDVSNITVLNNLTDAPALISGVNCGFTISGNLIGKKPLFQNAGQRDYHLLATSPAIDAGLLKSAPLRDFDGKPRPAGKAVELGAFEHSPAAPTADAGSPDGAVARRDGGGGHADGALSSSTDLEHDGIADDPGQHDADPRTDAGSHPDATSSSEPEQGCSCSIAALSSAADGTGLGFVLGGLLLVAVRRRRRRGGGGDSRRGLLKCPAPRLLIRSKA